jgi:hypothetical protein
MIQGYAMSKADELFDACSSKDYLSLGGVVRLHRYTKELEGLVESRAYQMAQEASELGAKTAEARVAELQETLNFIRGDGQDEKAAEEV